MKFNKYIIQHRQYHDEATFSNVYLPGQEARFCFSLEDKKQPYGVKVPGETCIPEGVYRATGTQSVRFKKRMIQIYNQDDMSVDRDGVRFTGVRIHGGNTVEDTSGCPLYAYNCDHEARIWGRASDDLLKYIDEQEDAGYEVYVIICS